MLRISTRVLAASLLTALMTGRAEAGLIALQNATATFSQVVVGGGPVGEAIDGSFSGNSNGWAIAQNDARTTNPETAVFETVTNLTAVGPLQFQLFQFLTSPIAQHTLGRFRLSVTSDSRATFADGLATGGDVTASWTVLIPLTATSTNGVTLTTLGDLSILASGVNPSTATYTITALAPFGGITGIRLEVLADASLPFNGPGRQPINGNFVLTELQLSAELAGVATPEPSTLAGAALAGVVGLVVARCRRKV